MLRGGHGGHAPKALVVISFCLGLVWRHVVIVWSRLPKHALCDEIIVLAVVGVVIVIDQDPKHGSRFPPVVRLRKVSRYVTGVVTRVEGQEIVGASGGGGFNGIYDRGVSKEWLLPAQGNEPDKEVAYWDLVDLGRCRW